MKDTQYLNIAKLILNIQAPTLEQCWSDGYESANTATLDNNPYKQGTANHQHWSNGWWDGFYQTENKSLYQTIAANEDTLEEEETLIHKLQNLTG